MSYPSCEVSCARELEQRIEELGTQTVSAFIAEPIMDTTVAGVVPPPEYYDIVRRICDRHGVLFITDEVITGLGRTGSNLGIDHWNVAPDIITVAKGLAADYAPLSAVLVSQKIVTAIQEGSGVHTQGFTYGGNPLSCSAGLAVLEYLEGNDLIHKATTTGKHLRHRLEELKILPVVGDVRGKGMFHGIEFVRNRETREPFDADARFAQRVVCRAYDLGLAITPGMPGCADGVHGDQLKIAPALIITKDQIDHAVELLRRAIEEVSAEAGSS